MSAFDGLSPAAVWRHFEALCRIPRGSGNEAEAAAHVLSVAERAGLPARRDAVGNIVVSRPASPGREGRPGVVLQGHLDMVCEQNAGGTHDFRRDPIRVVRRGEWLGADGTTLGADNGIGVAMALAVMEEQGRPLPPLEFLFTVDEETGLGGANGVAEDFVRGRRLLNLDSEEEGVVYIGCAGGQTTTLRGTVDFRPAPPAHAAFRVGVAGLRGGHSGLDIHLGRGNAIRLLARFLSQVAGSADLRLAGFSGGSKHNAIPREAEAVVLLPARTARRLLARAAEAVAVFREELAGEDDGVRVLVAEAARPAAALSRAASRRLLGFLFGLPHGVAGMCRAIPGLVETSTNLAVVGLTEAGLTILTSQRSSVTSRLSEMVGRIHALAGVAGLAAESSTGYPAWTPRPDSPLLAAAKQVHVALRGAEPHVKAIHAGLECGVLLRKFPGTDAISFGPDIRGAHSPDEAVRIDSVARVHDLLLALLTAL